MEISEGLKFVRAHHRGVLATTRADGRTQMSPVIAGVDRQGRVIVSAGETAYKVKHLRARPYGAFCGFTDGFFGDWVQVEGPVEIVALPEAMELLVDYYRDISGEHPDWDEYRAAMVRDQRVIIAITPQRVGPGRQG
jgi:PPOX class probable F420-dependent enzyme